MMSGNGSMFRTPTCRKAFRDIQPESPNGEVLTHVSGTLQAREAVLDNTIPQTAAVKREDALA